MEPVVRDKRVKFGDPRLNHSRYISPEAVWGGICNDFFRDNSTLKIATDFISCASVGQVGMKVPEKLDDSSSNGSRDIRLPHFLTNDDDTGERRSSHNALRGCPLYHNWPNNSC